MGGMCAGTATATAARARMRRRVSMVVWVTSRRASTDQTGWALDPLPDGCRRAALGSARCLTPRGSSIQAAHPYEGYRSRTLPLVGSACQRSRTAFCHPMAVTPRFKPDLAVTLWSLNTNIVLLSFRPREPRTSVRGSCEARRALRQIRHPRLSVAQPRREWAGGLL